MRNIKAPCEVSSCSKRGNTQLFYVGVLRSLKVALYDPESESTDVRELIDPVVNRNLCPNRNIENPAMDRNHVPEN